MKVGCSVVNIPIWRSEANGLRWKIFSKLALGLDEGLKGIDVFENYAGRNEDWQKKAEALDAHP